MVFQRLRLNIDEYAKGKNWYWYLPAWLFGIYLFVKLLSFHLGAEAPSIFISIAHNVNFVLHEMAHLITAFLPQVLVAAAGSFSEILLGSLLVLGAFKSRSYTASVFCFLWLMLALIATADYMADATQLKLALVSFGGGDAIHDWKFIFTELGVLDHSSTIASITRAAGILTGLTGVIISGWAVIRIAVIKAEDKRQEEIDKTMSKIASRAPDEQSDLYPAAQKGNLANRPDTEQNENEERP